jgi:hypothetical protein
MSVVINDLEVVAEPQPRSSTPGPARPPEPTAPTQFELRAMLRHAADRADRARAD